MDDDEPRLRKVVLGTCIGCEDVEVMRPTATSPLRDAVLSLRLGPPHPLRSYDAGTYDLLVSDVPMSASDADESERVGLRGVVLAEM